MKFSECFVYAVLLFFFCPGCFSSDKRRPIYNIAHMVNSIEEIDDFLKKGANVLEMDIQFFPNGSVQEIHHGSPCDCGRYCEGKANLEDYLKHIRNITDPNTPGNYYEQLVMLFFDLKMDTSEDKKESGSDIARHLLNYLWSDNEDREQEMRVMIYFENIKNKDVVLGLKSEFKRQGETSRLKDVGFEATSTGSVTDVVKTFVDLKIENVWMGDGNTNCLSLFLSDTILEKEIYVRDSSDGFIDKVYRWTIDLQYLMRNALYLGLDGMITNTPDRLLEILKEPEFQKDFRLATVEDNPFEKYVTESPAVLVQQIIIETA